MSHTKSYLSISKIGIVSLKKKKKKVPEQQKTKLQLRRGLMMLRLLLRMFKRMRRGMLQ